MSLVAEVSETYVHEAGAPKVVSAKHAAVDSCSFDFVPPGFANPRAGSKTHTVDASPVWGPQSTSLWSESFLVVQLVRIMKVMTKRGKAG